MDRQKRPVPVGEVLRNRNIPKKAVYAPLLGLIIGGSGFAFFPVLLYSPIFLLGAWAARYQHRYNVILLIISLCGTAAFIGLTFTGFHINRFPPDALWLACSAAIAYLYYGAAKIITIAPSHRLKAYINGVGQNALFYLVVSNLAIFSCAALSNRNQLSGKKIIAAYLTLMGVLYFLQYISVDLRRANKALQPPMRTNDG